MATERICKRTLDNGIPLTLHFRPVRFFRLTVRPDGAVEAVAPARMSIKAAMALANGRGEWVRVHRDAVLERAQAAPQYESGELVPLLGREHELRIVPGRLSASLCGDFMLLTVPEGSDAKTRRTALLTLYRRELERALPPLVAKYAAALGTPPPEWSLRDMRTRWGSCTPQRRTVRFALNLAAKPPLCLEYVVAHELTHLLVPNHGPEFHRLLHAVFPREAEAVRLLKD